ncbi:hypothetical protein ACFP3V_29890, partial [Streptacidiphilus monticola]
ASRALPTGAVAPAADTLGVSPAAAPAGAPAPAQAAGGLLQSLPVGQALNGNQLPLGSPQLPSLKSLPMGPTTPGLGAATGLAGQLPGYVSGLTAAAPGTVLPV